MLQHQRLDPSAPLVGSGAQRTEQTNSPTRQLDVSQDSSRRREEEEERLQQSVLRWLGGGCGRRRELKQKRRERGSGDVCLLLEDLKQRKGRSVLGVICVGQRLSKNELARLGNHASLLGTGREE